MNKADFKGVLKDPLYLLDRQVAEFSEYIHSLPNLYVGMTDLEGKELIIDVVDEKGFAVYDRNDVMRQSHIDTHPIMKRAKQIFTTSKNISVGQSPPYIRLYIDL